MAQDKLDRAPDRAEYFQVGGLKIAGKRWGSPSGEPVIALHGWLDNCASFDFLAEALGSSVNLLAIDLAGHGKSDHRMHLGAYNIWQDVIDVLAVAELNSWSTFHLIGHSRGAMTAFLVAGTAPERVASLSLLEGIRPKLAEDWEAPVNLKRSIDFLLSTERRKRHYYKTFAAAIEAREKGLVPVDGQAAKTLAQRGVGQDSRGFYWRYDAKLLVGSEVKLNLAQVNAFAAQLPQKKLLMMAEDGLLLHDADLMAWLASVPGLQRCTLPGDHHFHMGSQGREIAQMVWRLIAE